MNDSSLVSRIRLLLDWQQLSSTQFADRIKVGRPVVSHILSERNKPSLDVVQAILAAFPELSMAWLLQGAGSMLISSAEPAPAPAAPARPTAEPAAVSYAAPAQAPAAAATPPAPVVPTLPTPPAGAIAVPAAAPPPPAASPRLPIPRFTPSKSPVFQAGVAAGAEAAQFPAVGAAVPAAGSVPVLPELPVAPVAPAPVAAPPASETPAAASAAETPAATSPVATAAFATAAAPAPPSPDLALAQAFAEPGKAIRRIVIFYRDGSFADYQPEA